jgi:uncharacterized coiled-coil DUF342 family protein
MKTNLEKRIELYTKIETAENALNAVESMSDGSPDAMKSINEIKRIISNYIEELNNMPLPTADETTYVQ